MCFVRNHHTLVDGQPETYTADLLREWKQTHEATVANKRLSTDSNTDPTHSFPHHRFPLELVDHKINQEVELLRKSRFFLGFDSVHSASSLARMLLDGELSGGTKPTKSKALAWCARLLSSEDTDKAEEFLTAAKRLGACPEIQIADAFIASQKGDVTAALNTLAAVESPALSIRQLYGRQKTTMGHREPWTGLKAAGMNATELDPEGQMHADGAPASILAPAMPLWKTIDAVSEDDLRQAPALRPMVAMSYLLSAVPAELREIVFHNVPLFGAANFPLHSDADAGRGPTQSAPTFC